MSMFNIGDQFTDAFEELMIEIRGMRRDLERLRQAVEAQTDVPAKPVRVSRPTHKSSRTRKTAAV